MAAPAKDWGLFFTFSGIFAVIVFFDIPVLVYVSACCVAALGVFTLLYHLVAPLVSKISTRGQTQQAHAHRERSFSEEELEERRSEALRRIQRKHTEKADSFTERILRPREEARAERLEKEYKRSTGHDVPWSTKGEKLGQESGVSGSDGNAQRAALSRRLPGNVDKQHNLPTSTHRTTPSKKKSSLPPEPPEGAEGAVSVIMRTPQGRHFRRRVLTTDKVQLLLDYMTSLGYHPRHYVLSLTFPRDVISRDPVARLRDVNILHDTALNIEERGEGDT